VVVGRASINYKRRQGLLGGAQRRNMQAILGGRIEARRQYCEAGINSCFLFLSLLPHDYCERQTQAIHSGYSRAGLALLASCRRPTVLGAVWQTTVGRPS
jgi:hypothetical protein